MLKDPILEVNGLNLSLLRFMDGKGVISVKRIISPFPSFLKRMQISFQIQGIGNHLIAPPLSPSSF